MLGSTLQYKSVPGQSAGQTKMNDNALAKLSGFSLLKTTVLALAAFAAP